MKIMVDGIDLFEINEIKQRVIQNDIPTELFEEDIKRRLHYILMHKYERCFERLKSEWDLKLRDNGVTMIPTNPDEYALLVFSQPQYKNRSQRDVESINQ